MSTKEDWPQLPREQRDDTIRNLHRQGLSLHEISRTLRVSRNTVRRVVRGKRQGAEKAQAQHPIEPHLEALYRLAGGNGVRIRELARERHGIEIAYSTLTRLLRDRGWREPAPKRSGTYHFEPGAEMHHDTSPHRLTIGAKPVLAQCAGAILPVSRYALVLYYPRFTRFEFQLFITEALRFFDGAPRRCTIDNTSVAVSAGSGPQAVIAPGVRAFGEHFGMTFIPHAVGHADRKAHVERLFAYVEGNFLAGRSFDSWGDLNRQALAWCEQVANRKIKRELGVAPNIAFAQEQPSLLRLPRYIPPVVRIEQRVVDSYGYVHLETNRYSVPERLVGKAVEVHKQAEEVAVFFQGKAVARHPRRIGERQTRSTLKGHHTRPRHAQGKGPATEETLLRGRFEALDAYLDQLKRQLPGRGVQGMRRLLQMTRTYPQAPFVCAIERALHYRLFDLNRLEALIIERVRGDFFRLDDE